MQVHPEIAALRADPAKQRRNQAAMADALGRWHRSGPVKAIARDLSRYAKGAQLHDLSALGAWFDDHGSACAFVDHVIAAFTKTLRANPLAEAPFNHSTSAGFGRLQVLQCQRASLSLCSYDPFGASCAPLAARFVDFELVECVVSGSASVYRTRLCRDEGDRAEMTTDKEEWLPGNVRTLNGRTESRQVSQVGQSLQLLQLTRTPPSPAVTREYRLSDGKLILQSSGDKRASEQVMALGVLGAMGLSQTIAPMAQFAQTQTHDPDARWEAVRQVLAMDTAQGMSLLQTIAATQRDELAGPAIQLCRQLATTYPQLVQPAAEIA